MTTRAPPSRPPPPTVEDEASAPASRGAAPAASVASPAAMRAPPPLFVECAQCHAQVLHGKPECPACGLALAAEDDDRGGGEDEDDLLKLADSAPRPSRGGGGSPSALVRGGPGAESVVLLAAAGGDIGGGATAGALAATAATGGSGAPPPIPRRPTVSGRTSAPMSPLEAIAAEDRSRLASLSNLFPAIPAAELEHFVDVFRAYDDDVDGTLAADDCLDLLRSATGADLSSAEFASALEKLREDPDESIDVWFFVRLVDHARRHWVRPAAEQQAELFEAFRFLDADGRGKLPAATLLQLLEDPAAGPGAGERSFRDVAARLGLVDDVDYADAARSIAHKAQTTIQTQFSSRERSN